MDCSSLIVHIHSSRQLFLGPWTVSLFTVNLYDQHLWVDVPKKNLCHCLWLICLWPRPLLNIFHKNSLSFFSDSVSWLLFFEKTPFPKFSNITALCQLWYINAIVGRGFLTILFYEDPTSIALQFYISGWLMFSDFGCGSFSQEMAKAIFHFFF